MSADVVRVQPVWDTQLQHQTMPRVRSDRLTATVNRLPPDAPLRGGGSGLAGQHSPSCETSFRDFLS